MNEKVHLGNSRRTQLLYPTDIWPNNREILTTDGLFEVYPHYGMWTSNEEMAYTEDNWSFVVIPIKNANCIILRSTRFEYTYFLTEDKKKLNNSNIFYTSNLGDGNYRCAVVPTKAKYIGCTCRSANASSVLKGVTFCYLPTHGADRNVGVQFYNSNNSSECKSTFISCLGYSKLNLSVANRGAAYFYGENKNYLFGRGYGEESGSYKIPEGAHYVLILSYATLANTSSIFTYTLE